MVEKSPYIAREFSLRPQADYIDISRFPAASRVRWMAAIACELHLDMCHVDVQRAFVHAELKELILTRMPKDHVDLSGKLLLIHLNRSMYRLNQAPRSLHKHKHFVVRNLGLSRVVQIHVFSS